MEDGDVECGGGDGGGGRGEGEERQTGGTRERWGVTLQQGEKRGKTEKEKSFSGKSQSCSPPPPASCETNAVLFLRVRACVRFVSGRGMRLEERARTCAQVRSSACAFARGAA